MGSGSAKTLAEAKLAASGLTLADAKEIGMEILEPSATAKLFPKMNVPALKLVYRRFDGKKTYPTFRVRLLEQPRGAFGEQSDLRYLQPANTPPAIYLPSMIDWQLVATDASVPIMITEGELKAACACKHDVVCLGLGGVSSWRSSKLGWSFLPELETINWLRREVTICFDSDAASNPDIAHATATLTRELMNRGALPAVVLPPNVPGLKKTGIDDYIVSQGIEAFRELQERAVRDELAQKLWEFNTRFIFALDPGLVYDNVEDLRYDPSKYRSSLFANAWAMETTITPDGRRKLTRVSVADKWIEWEHRRQLRGITYRPGAERIHDGRINCWRGWGVESAKGSVAPWKAHLDYLFGEDAAARDWFEKWCLYPLAHPGVKLLTSAVIWSYSKGVGKSVVGEILGRVYGKNYSLIGQSDLDSPFNGWAVNRQLVMVDDISPYDSRSKADKLKKIITQPTILVNEKFIPTYSIPDCVNYYLTSNHPNALYIENDDRRYFVHEVTEGKRTAKEYRELYAWMNGDGPAALLDYARSFDFTGFDPYAAAPMTKAKDEMTDSAKGELESWITELSKEPASKLRVGTMEMRRDLYTARELSAFFDLERKGAPVATSTMALRLREYFRPAFGGMLVPLTRSKERFFVVRNGARWLKAKLPDLVKHVESERAYESGAKKGKF